MNQVPHVHAELIKAWADGAVIQSRNPHYGSADVGPEWTDVKNPMWYPNVTYRIKPERVYPKSTLTFEEMYDMMWPVEHPGVVRTVYYNRNYYALNFQSIADAAVKQYIQESES
jgi:hypothetical protein